MSEERKIYREDGMFDYCEVDGDSTRVIRVITPAERLLDHKYIEIRVLMMAGTPDEIADASVAKLAAFAQEIQHEAIARFAGLGLPSPQFQIRVHEDF